jgi:hypothetical protein
LAFSLAGDYLESFLWPPLEQAFLFSFSGFSNRSE